ncbi:DUF1178 family protein [Sphingomonas jeddahensis]|uniref:Uncharacterized protein n=1 Tax=Sphingomonas jeddahensis TaxID=1915074 RepID=A0A1V2EZN4_9SPHN|nr:DUF1178 family protein [Sphingomonas jeddahensis]ONF97639.1 hypothetical protein SPHI_02710 [Sphingomonas jeddahensis]
MIVFDLRCGEGHVFESWFASSAAYAEQRDRGLVGCPMCGATTVEKAVMAPNVAAKGNSRPALGPETVKAALQALAAAQSRALKGSRWVGRGFAAEARSMHLGEQAQEVIHGQATAAEAKALAEEGVPITPLPLPVVPPEEAN